MWASKLLVSHWERVESDGMSDGMWQLCPISRCRQSQFPCGKLLPLSLKVDKPQQLMGLAPENLEENIPEFAACSLLKLLQAGVQYPPFWTAPNGGNDGFHMIFFQNRVGTVGAAGKVDQCDERKCYHTQFAYCNLQPLLLIQSSAETCRKSPLYHSLPLFWRQKSEGLWSAHSYMTPIGWTWSYISVERGVNTAAWLTHSVPLSNPCQYPSMLFVFSFRIEMPLVFPVNHYSPSRCVCFQYLSLCTTFCGTCLMATYIIIYPLHQAETCLDCRGYWTFDCSPVYHLVSLSYKWVLAVDCYILAIPSPPKINTHKRWDFLLGLLSWFPFSGPCY